MLEIIFQTQRVMFLSVITIDNLLQDVLDYVITEGGEDKLTSFLEGYFLQVYNNVSV